MTGADDIPWALIAPFIVLYLILAVSALVSCMMQEETNGPKWIWVLIIAGISFIGPVSYFVIGKKTDERRRV
ncbi:PLD nuclease N-terminal domain-containing protein [Bacillus swezeyi]|uniref:PLD nuclease N-terminal domain-containing protein n=1 Tax=Bacillus swezeyi TaxID=1925020 RepID=UPI0039C71B49